MPRKLSRRSQQVARSDICAMSIECARHGGINHYTAAQARGELLRPISMRHARKSRPVGERSLLRRGARRSDPLQAMVTASLR